MVAKVYCLYKVVARISKDIKTRQLIALTDELKNIIISKHLYNMNKIVLDYYILIKY